MPLQTPEELERQIEDAGGVPVQFGGGSTFGLFRAMDEVAVGDDGMAEVVGAAETVTVVTGLLPGLARDAAITVDGEAREIRDHRRIEDGALTRIWLRTP